jgi:hypothetical protein
METRRWVNQSQPQTLYMATILLYFEAATGLLFGTLLGVFSALVAIAGLVAMAVGGYGIANERRWGYLVGTGASALQVLAGLYVIAVEGLGILFDFGFAASMLFAVVLLVLLVHPQSRDYQRIWFK